MAKLPVITVKYDDYLFEGSQAQLLQFITLCGLLRRVDSNGYGSDRRITVKQDGEDELDIRYELVNENHIERPDDESWTAIKEAKKQSEEYRSKYWKEQEKTKELVTKAEDAERRLADLEELVACLKNTGPAPAPTKDVTRSS